MQGIGQPLVSTLLLLLPLLSALAHKTDEHPSRFSKRSTADVMDGETPWQAPTSADGSTAAKRFNEFVGKRAQDPLPKHFEIAGERLPDEILYKLFLAKKNAGDSPAKAAEKRSPQYEFLGKQSLSSPLHGLTLVDVFGKRVQLPYEFVGKRIFGHTWERLLANTVEGDAMLRDVTDILNKRDAGEHGNKSTGAPRTKRYAEWLGKRGGPIADQLLRDLVNKRISAMMRNRLQNNANPEFIGRREEDYMPSPAESDLKKRYTEFIGK